MDYSRRCDDLAFDGPPDDASVGGHTPARRLWQRLVTLAHFACDQNDFEVARALLALAEQAAFGKKASYTINRRYAVKDIVSAYQRLWTMTRTPAETPAPVDYHAFESVRRLLSKNMPER